MPHDNAADLHQHFSSIWTAIVHEWTDQSASGSTSNYPALTARQRGILRQVEAAGLVNTVAVLTAPNKWIKDEVERTMSSQIRDVLNQKLGMHVILAISEMDNQPDAPNPAPSSSQQQPAEQSGDHAGGYTPDSQQQDNYSPAGDLEDIEDFQSEDQADIFPSARGAHPWDSMPDDGRQGDHGDGDDNSQGQLPQVTRESDAQPKGSAQPNHPAQQDHSASLDHSTQQDHSASLDHSAQPHRSTPLDHSRSGSSHQHTQGPRDFNRGSGTRNKDTTPGFGLDGRPITPTPQVDHPRLNPNYTFERFVIGNSNQMAAAACRAVAEQPGRAYNPLFLWGESGLGKTHLLHAIAHYALELNPNMKVMYTSTEELTNDFINSIANDTRDAFKRRYRSLDMLIVDDVQFLEGKESTQEEFFHTFNVLTEAGKHIVLSSDRPPARLTTLEDRLRTRFESGLMADVTSPELETRMAILTKKAMQDQVNLPEDVKIMIAERYDRSIRALEGALTRVIAYCSLENKEMNLSSAKIALQDILPDEVEVNPQVVIEVVAEYFDLTPADLTGKTRSKPVVHARQIAFYLCRELADISLPKLGAFFGGRDHSTVMHGERKIKKAITEDKKTFDQVQELLTRVKSRARG